MARRRSRRSYRRNPALMGITLPPLGDVIFTGAGLIVPPLVTNMVMPYLPADWRSNKLAYYGVKAASVIVPSMLARRFVSQRAGNLMLIGGAASLVIDLLRDFTPGLLPMTTGVSGQPFLGLYQTPPYQRSLGRYYGQGQVRERAVMQTPVLQGTPARLMPSERF